MLFRPVSRPQVMNSTSVTKIALQLSGLDTTCDDHAGLLDHRVSKKLYPTRLIPCYDKRHLCRRQILLHLPWVSN